MNEEAVQRREQENRVTERERWLRRQAMQIVVQLPDEESEALRVLAYARALVQAE